MANMTDGTGYLTLLGLGYFVLMLVGAYVLWQFARFIRAPADKEEYYMDTELAALSTMLRKRWPQVKKEMHRMEVDARMRNRGTFRDRLEQELIKEYFPTKKDDE